MSQSLSSGVANVSAAYFTEIPTVWRVPGQYMEVKPAVNQNVVMPYPARGLVMGQMYSSGTATAGKAYQVLSGAQGDGLWGAGSMLAKMCRAWLANNPYTPFDGVGIPDASSSAKAAGAFGIAGTAAAAGTQPFYVGGVRVPVPVNVGDTAAVVAANLFAALQLQSTAGYTELPSAVPTYTAGAASVTITAGHGGTLGNQIDLRINAQKGDVTPQGLTITVTPMTGGATDPAAAISTALASFTTTWYTDLAFAWTDTTNYGVLMAWLAGRFGAMEKLDCHGYTSTNQTYGAALSFLPNGKFNSNLPVQNGLTTPWEVAAMMAAQCCYWAAAQPALQMKTVPLVGMVAPASGDVFTQTQQEFLLQAGHSTYTVDVAGDVYLQRVVTTYRIDANGNPDDNWFDLKAPKVTSRVRYDWDNYVGTLYPRNDLTTDGTLAADFDPYAVTPGDLEASWAGRSALYEKNGWIQNSAVTAKNSVFAIDPNDGNRVNSRLQIAVMGSLIVLAGSLEFISTN